jgi:flavin reductase (DIM6/NTAB) family NADH-FMN oxidoreductase RutF
MKTVINPNELKEKLHGIWDVNWLLLTSGDFEEGKFNTMTVSWGSFGTIWNIPFTQVVVRPTRYTYTFMEKYPTFTLCSFPEKYRNSLQLLGSKSGRYSDKINESGLTPVKSSVVAAPSFKEADLIFECKKIYWDDIKPSNFIESWIDDNYNNDYHRIYFGQILNILKEDKLL